MRGETIDKILIDVLCGTRLQYLGVLSGEHLPRSLPRYPSASVATLIQHRYLKNIGLLSTIARIHT